MKKYALLLAAIAFGLQSAAGQAIGSWKAYPALQVSTSNEIAGDKVYSLCEGNLFSYDTQYAEVHVFDRLNGLHDSQIGFIRYCSATDKLVVVYKNGNVDLVYPDNETKNLKQLKEKNYANLTIYNVDVIGERAYICTDFGMVVLDTDREVFENTYDLGLGVQSCAMDNDFVYLSTGTGFYRGDRQTNLLDRNNWNRVSANSFNRIAFFKGELIGYNSHTGIFVVDQQYFYTNALRLEPFDFFTCNDDRIIVGNSDKVVLVESATDIREMAPPHATLNLLTCQGNTFWASQGAAGLQPYQLSGDAWQPSLGPIQPNSPMHDYFCHMHFVGNRLIVAGGEQNYSGIVRDGTAMYYENGTWTNVSEEGIVEKTGHPFRNITCMAQDPADPTHHFASSAGFGLYEFKDMVFVENYDEQNSPLRSILPNSPNYASYVRCDALQYDADGNLWMVNTEVDTVLVVRKADGTWTKLYSPALQSASNLTQIQFDAQGRLWVNSKRNAENMGGMCAIDFGGTIDDTSDDTSRRRNTFANQDGVSYTPYTTNCFAQDLDGQIWVGTANGLFVIEDPDAFIHDNDFHYTQIKIPRDDGSDYADYLLGGVEITALAVDAANRKWIGTISNGIYLVSDDGMEILQHFTTENSPLVSDQILSLAISPATGEVMIGTFSGLMSYMSDANTPAESLDKDHVRVYPNPVRPEYNGVIAVDGLTMNAEVKITTITGQLVYAGRANGGLFTWNGRDQRGRRVSSGVYNIISTNAEGKKAIVNRITFIH